MSKNFIPAIEFFFAVSTKISFFQGILLTMEAGISSGAVNPEWYSNMLQDRLAHMSKETADEEDNNAGQEALTITESNKKSMDYLRNFDLEHNSSKKSSHYKDTSMLKVPVLGRVHYVYDIQGFMQIGFIFFYWIYGTSTSIFVVLIPMYSDGKLPFPLLLCTCE